MKRNQVNRVFSIRLFPVIAAGATTLVTWLLNNNRRDMLIKSISWDVQITRSVTFDPIPLEQNDFMYISFGTQAGYQITQVFEAITGTAAFVTGQNLWFHKPQTYHFDSFYVSGELGMFLNLVNTDVVNAYQVYAQVIVEIEDLTVIGS